MEPSLVIASNCIDSKASDGTINIDFSDKTFVAIMNNIKAENVSPCHDESSYFEDSASIATKKNVYFSESHSQELTDTKLVDGKIVSMHTSYPSTALPIIKILSPNSEPHVCLKYCIRCSNVFRLLDNPLHIIQLRSIEKQNEFLKIDPSLHVDSCLCDFCWKFLDKTYNNIRSQNKKKETFLEKKFRLLERYVKKNVSKKKNQARICSIHSCSEIYHHKISVNEYEIIKKLFLAFESCPLLFIQSTKQTTDFLKFPYCLCQTHDDLILVMSTCQICGDKLNGTFNSDDWSMHKIWNLVLIENNLPLILKPGMFVCVICKEQMSGTNPGFPTIRLPQLREYILTSNANRFRLYGESQHSSNMSQGSKKILSPMVVPKLKEVEEFICVPKVKFSDPLVTVNYNYEIDFYKNYTESITNTAFLNVTKQNLCKLEQIDEELDFVKYDGEYFKTYMSNKLKERDDHKIPRDEGICQSDNLGIANDNSLQNVCQIDENESEIIGSHQVISEHDDIENNQSKLNLHTICGVSQDRSSMDLKEAVEPPNVIVDPAPIKRKQSNVIYDIISSKNVKKQKLNKKYSSYQNNSTEENSTNSYSNKNIAHVSPLQLNLTLKKNPYFHNKEKSSKKKCLENVQLDKYITDSDSLSDSEIFSDNDSDEIFPDDLGLNSNCEFVKSKLEINSDREIGTVCTFVSDSVEDLNCEIVPDVKTESDGDEQSHENIFVTEEEFNNEKLSSFKIVSNVQNGSDYEILLDSDNLLDIVSWSEKGLIKYKIMSEIKPSDNKGSTCIIISDNDEELNNKVFSTYKINVLKGSDTKILLDGEEVKIVSESENRTVNYKIKPSDNEKSDKCIVITDSENEFINKNLSTFKIVSNVNEGSDVEILLDGDKVYDIKSEDEKGKINYMIVSKDKVLSSANKRSQCTIIPNNEKKYNYKKVSDINIMPNGNIVCDSLGLKTLDDNNTINNDSQLQIKCRHSFPCLKLTVNEDSDTQQDTTQEYFKEFYFAIKYFFQNTENQSLKELYSQIGNDADMLLYLMENLRMLYNGELVISETADEFSKNYLKEQKTTLYNYFGDPKDSINASKPFIHPSSHLHQYSKRLSSNIEPLIIKDITTATSTSTRSSTIAPPKNNVALNKCVESKFNNIKIPKLLPLCSSVESRLIPYLPDVNQTFATLILQHKIKACNIQLPVAIKSKTVSKSEVLSPKINKPNSSNCSDIHQL